MKTGTTENELRTYLACIRFMSHWLAKQDGAAGKDTGELFDEFRDNVTRNMMGEVGGVG